MTVRCVNTAGDLFKAIAEDKAATDASIVLRTDREACSVNECGPEQAPAHGGKAPTVAAGNRPPREVVADGSETRRLP
jgi:hypothetical protein